MGFTEILFIAVIAILFLGPEKLPDAMVQIAKLFKSVRDTVNEAKGSFEEELRIKELREEALGYRRELQKATHDIAEFKHAMPNPAAEIRDAVASVAGERPIDDDLLADIEAAETQARTTHSSAQSNAESDSDSTNKTTDDAPDAATDDPNNWLDDGGLDDALVPQVAESTRPTHFKHLAEG
jgi:sec-independent protein translocase protein TatB